MPIITFQEGVPSGTIAIWTGVLSSIPSGWKLCDGTNGTPNLRNRYPKCVPTVGTNPGATGGSATVTLTEAQMDSHRHAFTVPDHEHDGDDQSAGSQGSPIAGTPQAGNIIGSFELDISSTHLVGAITLTGSDSPHNNLPKTKDVLYIQKE